MNRNDILDAAQKANAYKSSFDWYAFDENELVRFVKHCIDISITSSKREPLTDEEISDLFDGQIFHLTDVHSVIDFVRDIERAHGIGGEE